MAASLLVSPAKKMMNERVYASSWIVHHEPLVDCIILLAMAWICKRPPSKTERLIRAFQRRIDAARAGGGRAAAGERPSGGRGRFKVPHIWSQKTVHRPKLYQLSS